METFQTHIVLNAAAGTARKVAVAVADSTKVYRLVRLAYLPNAATASDGTNYASLRPYIGASSAVAAARTTASTGLTALTAEAITLTATGSDLEFSRASPLNLALTHAGTGAAVDVTLLIEAEEVRQ
jgi:hypothetical protein